MNPQSFSNLLNKNDENIITNRPLYSEVAAGTRFSPRMEQDEDIPLNHSYNHQEADATMQDAFTNEQLVEVSSRSSSTDGKSDFAAETKTLIAALVKSTSVEETMHIRQKIDIIKQTMKMFSEQETSMENKGKEDGSARKKDELKVVPVPYIPVFQVSSIDDTLVYHGNDSNQNGNANHTMYPTLDAYFNTFESVYDHHVTSTKIDFNWKSSLRLSFNPCSESVLQWYKRNLEDTLSDISWEQAKS